MPVVNREVVLPVTRERAWELITEPDWLGDEVEFEASEDAPLRVVDDGHVREGVVEEIADFERIVFRWGDSRVEWALDDVPGGTRFTVVEYRESDAAWGPKLQALATASLLCPA